MTLRRLLLRVLLAPAAALAACSGGEGAGVIWMGEAGAPRVLSFSERGEVAVAAEPPAIDAPVRAIAAGRDGAIVVLQETAGGAPPGVVLARSGARLATLDAADGTGAVLFPPVAQPWAAAEAADGRFWVTGRAAPAIFHPDGRLAGFAVPVTAATFGIAPLPDGRMLVTFGLNGVAAYAADGSSVEVLENALTAAPDWWGLDAVAARADGTVVVAVMHHGTSIHGGLVEAAVEPGRLAGRGDLGASVRLSTLPSALVLGDGLVLAGPSLGGAAPAACVERIAGDLSASHGCLAPGGHRGVARVR